MAIEKRGTGYRVYWRNPSTGRIERSPGGLPLREARKLDSLMKHKLAHERDSFTRAEPTTPDGGLTVTQVFHAYLIARQMSPRNSALTLSHFRPCDAEIGNVAVVDLTPAHMRKMVAVHRESGVSQLTLNRRVSIIKAALAWAEAEELAGPSPIRSFKCPRGPEKQTIPPSPAEVRKILEVAPPHVRRAVILAYHLGVRVGPSELFSMVWENVDMERRVVHVRAARKNDKIIWRELGISASLAPLLASWGDSDGWKGPMVRYAGKAVGSIRKAWASTLAAAGITRELTPYSLRHAFATYALSAGADVGAVAKVMGHSSTAMIHKHYQHVLDSQRRQVMESLPNVLGIQDGIQQAGLDGHVPTGFCIPLNDDKQIKQ